jgi:catechol 1,2-dioxygenase
MIRMPHATQINIDGDPYPWDDFAFATRDGLVPEVKKAEGTAGRSMVSTVGSR